ncbi:MAG: hypothetical protein PGN09_07000 [Sphingomonas fennica]
MDGALGITAFLGGLLLAAVLLFAMLRNRKRTPAEKARTEAATHDLYAREDRDAKRNEVAP